MPTPTLLFWYGGVFSADVIATGPGDPSNFYPPPPRAGACCTRAAACRPPAFEPAATGVNIREKLGEVLAEPRQSAPK